MKFINVLSISLLAAVASSQRSSDDGLSHPTPAPQPNLKDSSSEIPSGSLETLSGRPTSSLMRMVRKRSETPTPTTTIYVPAASSSLYNIKQTPI